MAKFHGNIGFVQTSESATSPGVWEDSIVLRAYSGDVFKKSYKWVTADKLNEDLNISNQISIVIDDYILNNTHRMKFVEYLGQRWKITDITVDRPRMTLSIGGLYNE